jgi:hypothetical protein
MRILIMGLPGAGKSTLAKALQQEIWKAGRTCDWFNADDVREKFNDWDFSYNGRIRQSVRMFELARESECEFVIADFVAPLEAQRKFFEADWTIWVDTIEQSRYEDTNKMFDKPEIYDFRITEQWAEKWAGYIAWYIVNNRRRPKWDNQKETVQMLGRWQPWHEGHRKLFERALAKTGQVAIMVRDCQGWNGSNPFNFFEVCDRIKKDLEPLYQGQFSISLVPNIVNITYGRDVGYKIEQETFDEETHNISATKIRKEMGLE